MYICHCKKEISHIVTAFAPRQGRLLCLDCRVFCGEHADTYLKSWGRHISEKFPIKLTARTRPMLVKQILAQTVGKLPGYLPKSDIRRALVGVQQK